VITLDTNSVVQFSYRASRLDVVSLLLPLIPAANASGEGTGGGGKGGARQGTGGWVGLQKLITVLGRFDPYKGSV
jgi:hypothetical protein